MIDFAGLLAVVIALAAAGCRLWASKGARPGLVFGFAVSMAISSGLLSPAVSESAAQLWEPLCRVVPLLGIEVRNVALCFLALMAYGVRGGVEARRERRQLMLLAGVIAVEALSYLAAGVDPEGSVLASNGPGSRAALVAYDLFFLLYSVWCVSLFVVVIHRSARQVPAGVLRVGVRLVAAGGLSGLVWTALDVIPLFSQLLTGRQEYAEDVYSAPWAVLTLTLGLGGATLAAWGRTAAAPLRWLRAWRSYRRLGPLWTALHQARPEIALEPAGWRGSAHLSLYRRVIEIRDGQLALRGHVHPQAVEWAGSDAGSEVVEAAVIAAALEAAAAGRSYPGSGYRAPEMSAELTEEAARLELIAQAFHRSAAVAEVRRRVRASLAEVPG
ncbi:MAB_1171c family putative transporter [Kitasatospora sp. NPDC002227]|uniref:MAB_1171c family putative transporter n=1 Tax=Kitasatospora sp. NPDC002227 TaxID=3154773 RepID=UPI00332C8964